MMYSSTTYKSLQNFINHKAKKQKKPEKNRPETAWRLKERCHIKKI